MDRTTGKDLYSEKYNIRFYHIAKNGMTAMIKILELDWVAVEDINPNAKTIAIIRDPFERFISGCVRVWKSGDPNVYLD